MKNSIIISLVLLFCISAQCSYAQVYSKSESLSLKEAKKHEKRQASASSPESKTLSKNLTEQDYVMYEDYLNFGIMDMTLKQDNSEDLKSNYGLSASVGRTFFLHKKPIGGIMRFGLDATWLDVNYTNYRIKHITNEGTDKYSYHQGEISMHIGPSVSIAPDEKWNINAYFRYAPSLSLLYADDAFYGNYATFFVTGASCSYGAIGLGAEARFGNCKYHEFASGDGTSVGKVKYSGWKIYLTYKF